MMTTATTVIRNENQKVSEGVIHTKSMGTMATATLKPKTRVENILSKYFDDKEKIKKCLQELEAEQNRVESVKSMPIEVIKIPGSDVDPDWLEYFMHVIDVYALRGSAHEFKRFLKKAINAKIEPFMVPVYDPSLDENGNLQFLPGKKPATNLTYDEMVQLGKMNGLELGDWYHYILFIYTMIHRMYHVYGEGKRSRGTLLYCVRYFAETETINLSPEELKQSEGITGANNFYGKSDLLNTYKILKDQFVAGGKLWPGDKRPYSPIAFVGNSSFIIEEPGRNVPWYVIR